MSNGKCDKLEKDIEFQVAYFRATGQGCLSWAALPDYETELTVILRPSGQDMAPGRYVLPSSDVVPGKLYIHKNIFYTVYKGEGVSYSTHTEVLQVAEECHVTWMNYTAGDDIPVGGVVGGHLFTKGGSNLYLVRAPVGSGDLQYGYYDPGAVKGFIEFNGVNAFTNVDMMVQGEFQKHLWALKSKSS